MNFILHLLSAAISSIIVTAIIIITQCRYTFSEIRNAFVSHVKECNNATSYSSKTRHELEGTFLIGFFHPHCSAGGGGERVLWKTIEALGQMKEDALKVDAGKQKEVIKDDCIRGKCRSLAVVIYTIDEASDTYAENLMKHVQDRFSISISPTLEIHYIHLHDKTTLLQKRKRLTMIAESWGTIRLAWCALNRLTPHVFMDTTGAAFTCLVAKVLAGCKVGCYIHYPTISTDMLSLVWERRPNYNNGTQISTHSIVTYAKLIYYVIFAILYGLIGSLFDLVMVNSTWTKDHIRYLWRFAGDIHTVFPPVDIKNLSKMPLDNRENLILSIGQFRPEKDHILQLKSFALLLDENRETIKKHNVKLILIGSCRGEDDNERVDQLQKIARELGIQEYVEFVLNQPYPVLKHYLSRASVGIHTMWNEHFGIGVVEMMAAGLVTVAHNSGGPKSDIIVRPWDLSGVPNCNKKPTGCLASTAREYATAMNIIITKGPRSEDIIKIRQSGRNYVERFSDQVFLRTLRDIIQSSSLLK